MLAAVKDLTSPLVRCNVLRALKFGAGALHLAQAVITHTTKIAQCGAADGGSLTGRHTGMGHEDILPVRHGISQDIWTPSKQYIAQIMGAWVTNSHALRDSVSGVDQNGNVLC